MATCNQLLLKVSGAMISSKNAGDNRTIIDLTFDQIVIVTESFYPPFSPLQFLTVVGGSLGLWLGVGIMQMVHLGLNWTTWMRSSLFSKNKD